MRELQQQEPGLDRLAEADSVRDEQSRCAVAKYGERRLELVGQQADRRLSGRTKTAERMQADERAIELVEPATRTDDAGATIAVNCSQTIEGCQQRLLSVAADLPQPQGGAVDRPGDTGNAPSPPARDDPAAARLRRRGIGCGIHGPWTGNSDAGARPRPGPQPMARRYVFGVNALRIGPRPRLVTPPTRATQVGLQPLRTAAGDEVAGTARRTRS